MGSKRTVSCKCNACNKQFELSERDAKRRRKSADKFEWFCKCPYCNKENILDRETTISRLVFLNIFN